MCLDPGFGKRSSCEGWHTVMTSILSVYISYFCCSTTSMLYQKRNEIDPVLGPVLPIGLFLLLSHLCPVPGRALTHVFFPFKFFTLLVYL